MSIKISLNQFNIEQQNLSVVMWLECRLLDTEVDGSNPSICMLCP